MTMKKKIASFIKAYSNANAEGKKQLELYAFRHQMRWNAIVNFLSEVKTDTSDVCECDVDEDSWKD